MDNPVNEAKIGGCWPTRNQELLLQASLLKGERFQAAWREWKSRVDIDVLDLGSHRLLPLLYHNLASQNIDDPLMKKLKGVYLWYLSKNHLMVDRVVPLLERFRDAGIRVMLLKGTALILLHYKNYALRPLSDVDILVEYTRAKEAIELLKKAGWKPEYASSYDIVVPFRHSCGFEGGKDRHLDLHWNVLLECRGPKTDQAFWDHAVKTQVQSAAVLAMDATDQLLHACVHGLRWNLMHPCRWVADAMVLVRDPEQPIDWERLLVQARERNLTFSLKEALEYLDARFDAPIPPDILKSIRGNRVSVWEKAEFGSSTRPHNSALGSFHVYCFEYWRILKNPELGPGRSFGSYLKFRWGLKSLLDLPFALVFKTLKRIPMLLGHKKGG